MRRKIELIRFWNHIVDLDSNRLPRKIFDIEFNAKLSWCSDLQSLFTDLQMQNYFEHELKIRDINGVKNILNNNYEQHLLREINSKPKLRTYKLVKPHCKTETYVMKHMARRKRSIYAQFRIGILPLKVETGRFTNIPLEDRVCDYCDSGEVEDEAHFLFDCTLYIDLREVLIHTCLGKNGNFRNFDRLEKMKYILTDNDILMDSINYI